MIVISLKKNNTQRLHYTLN